jgi:hypothetical protein
MPWVCGSGSALFLGSWEKNGSVSGSRLKTNVWNKKGSKRSHGEQWSLTKKETWRVCRPVVADMHHFDEEQGPDPDPYSSEKRDPDPH